MHLTPISSPSASDSDLECVVIATRLLVETLHRYPGPYGWSVRRSRDDTLVRGLCDGEFGTPWYHFETPSLRTRAPGETLAPPHWGAGYAHTTTTSPPRPRPVQPVPRGRHGGAVACLPRCSFRPQGRRRHWQSTPLTLAPSPWHVRARRRMHHAHTCALSCWPKTSVCRRT